MMARRALPIGVIPQPGEALESWLGTVAAQLDMTFGDFLMAVCSSVDGVHLGRAGIAVYLAGPEVAAVAAAIGVDPAVIRAMTLARYDGHLVSVDMSGTRLRWSTWNPSRSRFCPACLTAAATTAAEVVGGGTPTPWSGRPQPIHGGSLVEVELWRLLPDEVRGVDLSPVTPLGTCAAVRSWQSGSDRHDHPRCGGRQRQYQRPCGRGSRTATTPVAERGSLVLGEGEVEIGDGDLDRDLDRRRQRAVHGLCPRDAAVGRFPDAGVSSWCVSPAGVADHSERRHVGVSSAEVT